MKKIFLIIILLLTAVLVIDSITYMKNYDKSILIYEQMKQEGYELAIPTHMDVFTKQNDYFQDGLFVIVQFIYPLLLIILGCSTFHKKLHSGFFKNIIVRENFKKYINKEIFTSWQASILIPILILITFIFSCVVTKFNFNLNNYLNMTSNIVERKISSEIISMVLMMLNLFIVSLACINVGLVFTKKNKNFIISSMLAYLAIIVYQIGAEIIVGPILSNIFNCNFFANGLTLFNFWYYDSGVTPLNMFIYSILLFIVTFVVLNLTYKSKEDVIIHAEK
jgi:hypothetical protein